MARDADAPGSRWSASPPMPRCSPIQRSTRIGKLDVQREAERVVHVVRSGSDARPSAPTSTAWRSRGCSRRRAAPPRTAASRASSATTPPSRGRAPRSSAGPGSPARSRSDRWGCPGDERNIAQPDDVDAECGPPHQAPVDHGYAAPRPARAHRCPAARTGRWRAPGDASPDAGATSLTAMTTRAQRYDAVVTRREQVSPHLVRLTLSVPGFDLDRHPRRVGRAGRPGPVPDPLLHGALAGRRRAGPRRRRPRRRAGHRVGGRRLRRRPRRRRRGPGLLRAAGRRRMAAAGRRPHRDAGDGAHLGVDRRVPTRVWAEVPDDLSGYLPDGRRRHLAGAAGRGPVARWPRSSRGSTGPRARATSGWRASPRRCGRSAST